MLSSSSSSSSSPPRPLPINSSHHDHYDNFALANPLDIPFIDHYLLQKLLFPKLVNAIQLIFPQIYAEWTATTSSTTTTTNTGSSSSSSSQYEIMRWKRILEGILQSCLLLGSCYHHRVVSEPKKNSSNHHHRLLGQEMNVVITPAMQSLGMRIHPTFTKNNYSSHRRHRQKNDDDYTTTTIRHFFGSRSIPPLLQSYLPVGKLLFVTVIIPTLYKELKMFRKRQLEIHDQQLQMENIRREEYQLFHSTHQANTDFVATSGGGDSTADTHSNDNHHTIRTSSSNGSSASSASDGIIQRRARKRQSRLLTYLMDITLGMGEVFVPPLQLINYLFYIYGKSYTPQLGMLLAGWEYCNMHDMNMSTVSVTTTSPTRDHHHLRSINFQYAHRRLLVEEGLRAISLVLPPALPYQLRIAAATGGGVDNTLTALESNTLPTEVMNRASSTPSPFVDSDTNANSGRRNGWTMMRRKFLSFMGVSDDNEAATSSASEARRYSLTCSLCNTEYPSIPYIASCGHCYCYVCLRMAVTNNVRFRCVDCGQRIDSSTRPHSWELGDSIFPRNKNNNIG